MDKYEIIKQIGDGTYGTVAKAVHKKTNQLVAIKRMKQKYYSWDECIKLAEVQALRKLHAHPNVIKLKEVLRERNELFFVFEFMDGDLLGVIRNAKANPPLNPQAPMIPHTKVRAIMYQLFQSLAHLHKCGYFHRDLKPENLLIKKDPSNANGFDIVKLADFGLVKEIRAKPPFTDYVSTRWYRGPELLLQDRNYSSPVDMWAAGCMMAELISTRPLFPGSNELDQLFRIISVFGPPTEKSWPEGCAMARKLRYTFPNPAVTPLRKMLPAHIPPNAYDLIEKLLIYDPRRRLSAAQALQHPYFTVGGIGLDGPLAFQQPLETAGVLRPQNTSSAPPSQLSMQQQSSNIHTNGISAPVSTQQVTKPGSADRPIMPPVQISRPSALPSSLNSNNGPSYPGGANNPFNNPPPPLRQSPTVANANPLPALGGGGGSGYGSQYNINQANNNQHRPSLSGLGGSSSLGGSLSNSNNANGLPARNPYIGSTSPPPQATTNGSNSSSNNNALARPPTKIDTTASPLPPPSNSPLPYQLSSGSGGTGAPRPSVLGNITSQPHRSSIAPGNDDLDDLLEEFSKGVARDGEGGKSSAPGGVYGNAPKPSALGPLKSGVSSSGLAGRPTNNNIALPQLNTNATPNQIDESPLQKLLNSARYRNGENIGNSNGNGAIGGGLGRHNSTGGNGSTGSDILQPTSTFASRPQPSQLSTPSGSNGAGVSRRKVVPAATQLTANVKPLIDKLSQFNSPSSDPTWLN